MSCLFVCVLYSFSCTQASPKSLQGLRNPSQHSIPLFQIGVFRATVPACVCAIGWHLSVPEYFHDIPTVPVYYQLTTGKDHIIKKRP